MPAYDWVLWETKHFGPTWVPVAKIQLRASSGRFRSFEMCIDSGAVVSLLRRSVATYLGIDPAAGKRIDLTSVGGRVNYAHIHELAVRLSDGLEFTAPFAIAEAEDVPNLLGRKGLFERFAISFDPIVRRTFIQRPS